MPLTYTSSTPAVTSGACHVHGWSATTSWRTTALTCSVVTGHQSSAAVSSPAVVGVPLSSCRCAARRRRRWCRCDRRRGGCGCAASVVIVARPTAGQHHRHRCRRRHPPARPSSHVRLLASPQQSAPRRRRYARRLQLHRDAPASEDAGLEPAQLDLVRPDGRHLGRSRTCSSRSPSSTWRRPSWCSGGRRWRSSRCSSSPGAPARSVPPWLAGGRCWPSPPSRWRSRGCC